MGTPLAGSVRQRTTPFLHQSNISASAKLCACASLSDNTGEMSRGQSMASCGSDQMMEHSASLAQKSVVLYKKSAVSDSTMKACAKPSGIHSWRLFSADSVTPTHLPKVGELRRISTATS